MSKTAKPAGSAISPLMRTLATYMAAAAKKPLPKPVIEKTKHHLLDTIAAMVITLPFIFPLVTDLGYNPIWWGIILVMTIEVGMITPPIGMNVFVLHGVAGNIPLKTIFKGIFPFFYADVVRIVIVILIPPLALWLPGILGYKL